MNRSLLSTIAATALSLPLAAQTYQITDIGTLAGAPTFATAISDNGVVCGYALPTAFTAKAWVFDNSTLSELPGLGGSDTRALAVATDGKIYGYSADAAGLVHGVRWENGVVSDLGPPSGVEGWLPQAVNASGVVAGHTGTLISPASAFTLAPAFSALPPLAGAPAPATSAAYDINDAGRVVGSANWIGGGTRAFRTDAGGALMSLGTLGANDSTAMSINTAGDVAGYSVTAANATHAFLFADLGGMRDLGVLAGFVESRAFAVNDSSQVVGECEDAAGAMHAFLWNGSGALLDLNPLIPPNSGFVLNEAQDINSGGDIVGVGTVGGVAHAFLLERFEGLDTLAPIVTGSVTVTNGSPASIITVNFWDNEKVVGATTHSTGLAYVTGPGGYSALGTVQSWFAADRQASTTTFTFTPPGGSWNGADNGTYEIRLAPNVVSDLAGNRHPGGVIGTFVVGIQTTPTLTIGVAPATTVLGSPVNLTITATGSYPAAAGDVFSVAIDWDGDGTALQNVNAVSGTAIPHTFTTLGTHTVRVTVTDPHALTSSERTAQVAVGNAALPLIATTIATQTGYFNSMGGVRIAESAGTLYMFGGYPLDNDSTPAVTWNYANAAAQFVFRGNLDNGPIQPEGAGVDGRGRVCIYGGNEPAAAATASAYTFTIAGGVGGGIAAKPGVQYGATARDNLGRLYSISGTTTYRYDAGASGNGVWSTLAALPNIIPSCASYDGAGRIIAFSGTSVWAYSIAGNAWTQLPNSPVSVFGPATLGTDGLIYLCVSTGIYAFNPATNLVSALGTTAFDHTGLPAALGNNGLLYLIGASYVAGSTNIETINTAPAATLAPRITSTATGTSTLSVGTAWSYAIAASGKPAPAFSLVSGPAGMSISAAGVVSWTPSAGQIATHNARVRATNSAGFAEQMMTLTVLGTPPDTTAPAAVTGIIANNITTTSADLSWSASTDNVSVVAYRLQTRRTGGTRWHRVTTYPTFATTTGLTWHITGTTGAGITYYIVAVDAAGNESTRSSTTVSFLSPPALTADQSGTFGGARAIVTEPWTGNIFTAAGNPLPSLAPTAFPTGAVWHSTAANAGYFTWTPVAGQEGVQIFTTTATSATGSATLSRSVTTYPQFTDLIPPSQPGSLVVDQLSFDSVRATWTAATDNYGVVTYRATAAHRQPRSRFHRGAYNDHVVSFVVPAATTQIVFPGLRPSTSYTISIAASDAAGLSGYARTTDIRTLLQPFVVEAAQTTTVLNGDGSMTMTWPSYGYYWKFTVECSEDLVTWIPVPPAAQWPNYDTAFTFTPAGAAQRFYRVKAMP